MQVDYGWCGFYVVDGDVGIGQLLVLLEVGYYCFLDGVEVVCGGFDFDGVGIIEGCMFDQYFQVV